MLQAAELADGQLRAAYSHWMIVLLHEDAPANSVRDQLAARCISCTCCLLPAACCFRFPVFCALFSACRSFAARCPLRVLCCLLPAACCCLLPVACCLLPAACCLLSVACCLLPAVCCLLSAVACCLLPAACCLIPDEFESNEVSTLCVYFTCAGVFSFQVADALEFVGAEKVTAPLSRLAERVCSSLGEMIDMPLEKRRRSVEAAKMAQVHTRHRCGWYGRTDHLPLASQVEAARAGQARIEIQLAAASRKAHRPL